MRASAGEKASDAARKRDSIASVHLDADHADNPVKVVVVEEIDFEKPLGMLAVGMRDATGQPYRTPEMALELFGKAFDIPVGQIGCPAGTLGNRRTKPRDPLLQRADRQLVVDAVAGQQHALLLAVERKKNLGMADRDEPVLNEHLHLVGKLEKTDRVRHRRTPAADFLGDVGLREVEAVLKRLVADRLFDRIQILALDVLRRRHDRGGLVVRLDQRHADLLPSRKLRRPKTALARDQLKLAVRVLAKRLRQLPELVLLEIAARLVGTALDVKDIDLERRSRLEPGLRRRS